MTHKIRILIADDHAIVRLGLASLFGTQRDMEVVGKAEDGLEAVRMARELRPDAIVMDLMMPKQDGAVAIRQIQAFAPQTKILILTSYGQSNILAAAIQAGAAGALSKASSDALLVPAIRRILQGETVISDDLRQQLAFDPPVTPLSLRQQEILNSLVLGHTNQEIATCLGIQKASVEKYLTSLYQKLGAANRAEAVAIALRKQLLRT